MALVGDRPGGLSYWTIKAQVIGFEGVVGGLALLAVAGGWWLVVVFCGWSEGSGRVSVGVGCLIVKEQGGRLLTAIGREGGTEDRVGFGALRHHVIRVGYLRRLHGSRGLGRLYGLRLGAGLPVLLQLLELAHGSSEGTLQTHALHGDAVQQGKLLF